MGAAQPRPPPRSRERRGRQRQAGVPLSAAVLPHTASQLEASLHNSTGHTDGLLRAHAVAPHFRVPGRGVGLPRNHWRVHDGRAHLAGEQRHSRHQRSSSTIPHAAPDGALANTHSSAGPALLLRRQATAAGRIGPPRRRRPAAAQAPPRPSAALSNWGYHHSYQGYHVKLLRRCLAWPASLAPCMGGTALRAAAAKHVPQHLLEVGGGAQTICAAAQSTVSHC